MRKNPFLILTVLLSFIVFSCASTKNTPEDLPEENNVVVVTENTNTSDDKIEETGTTVDSNPDDFSEEDNTSNDSSIFDTTKEELEEIEEPLVRDLIIPVINDDKLSDGEENTKQPEASEPTITEELVTEIDILPELQISDSENQLDLLDNIDNTENNLNVEDTTTEFTTDLENNDSDEEYPDTSDENAEESSENPEENDLNESEDSLENQDAVEEEIVIIPSRSVTLKKGENLEVIYPGSGWIYMGSTSEYSNMASKGRKLGAQDTKYTLLAKEPGTQIHHFYKVDNLTGEYIDDYIEVTILDKKGNSKTIVTAPAYEEIVPQKPVVPAKASVEETVQQSYEQKSEETISTKADETKKETTVSPAAIENISTEVINQVENTDDDYLEDISIDEDYVTNNYTETIINTDELLEAAQNLYTEEKYSEANDLLVDFFEYSADRIDEALYLQGQILEADSEIKNIKAAIQNYEALIKNYPSSIYWNDANKRIKYLRKFYYISN